MTRYWFIFVALCALALTMLAFGCSKSEAVAAPGSLQLQVISPHGSDIKREFGEAFSRWHVQHFGTPVEVIWPDIGGGGTGNIVRYLNAAYSSRNSSGDDVIFGGGSASFNSYLNNNFLVALPALTPAEGAQAGWTIDPVPAVPATASHSPLHGKDNLWVAATMSTFGMAINKERIAELGRIDLRMKEPRVWEDIAGPQWFGKLSLADPSKSGSVKTSYEMIFQQYGWEKGWALMVELFANASLLRESGPYPADDAANADAVAGIVIDFYGRLQISRVGPRVAAFVVPEGGTSLDADPIALLKGAPHAELASQFIRFVVSPEGQRLWIDKPGVEGGPRKAALGRMSVLPELYQTEGERLFDPRVPPENMLQYDNAKASARNGFLGDLIKAALIDNHDALVRARQAVLKAGDPPELVAKLTAVPTYRASRVVDDKLEFSNPKPLGNADQALVAQEYAPLKGDPRGPYAEQLQNGLKDLWRESMAQRFAEMASEAHAVRGVEAR